MVGLVVVGAIGVVMSPKESEPGVTTGKYSELAEQRGCMNCHGAETTPQAPSYKDIASRYTSDDTMRLAGIIIDGSRGKWGENICPSKDGMSKQEALRLSTWILGQKPAPVPAHLRQ